MKYLLLFISIITICSCGPDWKAEVKSDTSWSGSFGNSTVDGSGNQTVNLPNDEIVCCVVQKDTEAGYLEVKIVDKGGSLFATDGEKAKTTADYGVVSVCSE
jgi:hypothetical protein